MDDFERAAQLEEADREIALQQHAERQKKAEPRDDCADCADPLPDHRKPFGTCIECQDTREKRARLYRRD